MNGNGCGWRVKDEEGRDVIFDSVTPRKHEGMDFFTLPK